MVSLRSTRLFCAVVISSLLAACGSDSNPNPGNEIGAGAAQTQVALQQATITQPAL